MSMNINQSYSSLKLNTLETGDFKVSSNKKENNIKEEDQDSIDNKINIKKNNFNKLIEQSINIDNYKFDVRKYLPKDDRYSSKILRKYKSLIENKRTQYINRNTHQNFDYYLTREMGKFQNSIIEIQNDDSLLEGDSKLEELNSNFLNQKEKITEEELNNSNETKNDFNKGKLNNKDKYLNIDEELDDYESLPEGCFEIYAQEDDEYYDSNIIEDSKFNKKNSLSEIEQLNFALLQKSKGELLQDKEYSWYCLDYDNKKQKDIIVKFLSYEL